MKKHLIIGTSAAAIGVLNKLRALDSEATITCISDEFEFPYNKCFLADYLSGSKDVSALSTKPQNFFEQNRICLVLGKRVVAINASEKKIFLDDGQSFSYDTLFIGTGSSPAIPEIVANNKHIQGIFPFHTLANSSAVLNSIAENKVRRALVIGSGLSGLEAADALATRGLQVTLLSRQDLILRRFIDEAASSLIERMMKNRGVELLKCVDPQELITKNNKVCGIRLNDMREIEADLVVFATGLRPNSELARTVGITLHDGYVSVNDTLQTSNDSIWAGGDCCMVRDQLSGELVPSTTWPDAMMQGMTAAYGMSGQPKKYPGIAAVVSSSFFGTQLVTAGNVLNLASNLTSKVREGEDFYHKMVLEGELLRGYLLVGHTQQAPLLKRAILTGQPL